ncbi:MAG: helix-turn-helix domain-containing protein [Lachnospiraceae bacterium]|nr:helix-turn-helix domain-containing protein [Lachnospiraceae bacterium]
MIEVSDIKLYDLKEVCKKFNASIQTVRRWIKSGKLNAKKIGRNYYCTDDDLKEFLKRC